MAQCLLQPENASSASLAYSFQCKVPILLNVGSLVVKTIDSWADYCQVLEFRTRIFHSDFQLAESVLCHDGVLDWQSDHLVVIDQKTQELVGSYSVLASSFSTDFLIQEDFFIDGVLALPGEKLELNWVCIDPRFRGGHVIRALWLGLAAYVKKLNIAYMFGASSMGTTNPVVVAKALAFFQAGGHWENTGLVQPRVPFYQSDLYDLKYCETSAQYSDAEIPHLLLSYIKAGGKILGQPVFNYEHQCTDFFTLFCIQDLNPALKRLLRI